MLGSFVFKSVFTVGSLPIHILFSEIVTMFLTGNMIGWVVGGCVLLICARQNVCTDGLGWDRLLARVWLISDKEKARKISPPGLGSYSLPNRPPTAAVLAFALRAFRADL